MFFIKRKNYIYKSKIKIFQKKVELKFLYNSLINLVIQIKFSIKKI